MAWRFIGVMFAFFSGVALPTPMPPEGRFWFAMALWLFSGLIAAFSITQE